MSIDLDVPPTTAAYDVRGAVMRITGVSGGPLEVRVDEGLVFARYLGQEPRIWSDVSVTSVMDLFAADSPVSTFLRKQGALPLRQVLLASLTASIGSSDDQS
ncbi:hypothetical protein [Gemmatimonas groenlandica]|uniref:Uncharacterized protein n=1 Tax=Gemmatimonas groenlandica TaxID=2732249 RepID=A0A6M4ISR8_9BACT|nr:hypothetical protein [Gemmatimonas groenlandica]QJR37710.1 hypothetical protein HKW67_20385 [Gemmatimonas groenlandica]